MVGNFSKRRGMARFVHYVLSERESLKWSVTGWIKDQGNYEKLKGINSGYRGTTEF